MNNCVVLCSEDLSMAVLRIGLISCVLCNVVYYNIVLYSAVHCIVGLCVIVQYCIMLCSLVHCSALQF